MEKINYSIYILSFIILIKAIISEYNYYYNPEDVINFINQEPLDNYKEVFKEILRNLNEIFSDAYAFNEIAINPTQPFFNNSYHNEVNLREKFNEFINRVENGEISQNYEFYREIMKIISKLKDSHIQINWNFLNLDKFFIVSPVYFEMRYDTSGEPKIFLKCSDASDPDSDFVCPEEEYEDYFITSINDINPFDFINNFGGDFVSTKNLHGTFSFKLDYHNEVPLSDYPLDENDLGKLIIEFDSGEPLETQYYIASDEIEIEDIRILRNLNHKIKDTSLKTDNNDNIKRTNEKKYSRFKNIHNKNKKRRRLKDINWNLPEDDIELNCSTDDDKEINIFYITTFLPKDKDAFIEKIENCYFNFFDKNKYPILVISHLNDGGFVYLSQLFLGIISPLISINMYKGRIRLTDSFKETDDIIYYIETNLTNSNNCLHTNYEQLKNNNVKVDYGDNIQQDLSEMFFLNNITIHNRIENWRKKMNYKRKPTEILIFTDGYSFSAASLFMQYLQRGGGAIIASYLGNPKYIDDIPFDISQSPSPVFTHNLLKIFSPDNYKKLLDANNNYKNYENEDENKEKTNDEWEIQMPGIQSFYGPNDYQTPLEYEVVPADEKSNIFVNFDGDSYNKFITKAKDIFEKYKTECNPKNKNLLKISDECDSKFPNDYTHGGYECGEDWKWSNKCVASYCDPGYFFHIEKKKCVKDVCSSISVTIIEDNDYSRPNLRYLSIFTLILYTLLIF